MSISTQKIVVIAGPTASGKSTFAITLAKKIGGEIISADSRQVYQGLDIGSGKITKREQHLVPHHLLDVASPKRQYTVTHFLRDAKKAIKKISSKEKIPVVCGGTMFWIDALVYSLPIPRVAGSQELRRILQTQSTKTLFLLLKTIDPRRARFIDANNPRRLIRALEINILTGDTVPKLPIHRPREYTVLYLALRVPNKQLRKQIRTRLYARVRQGMIAEARRLHVSGVSYKRMYDFGLEYRRLAEYLTGKISKERMLTLLEHDIWKYAKRQITWLKKNKDIQWIDADADSVDLVQTWIRRESSQT